ncbi:MAG: hypothetical protein SGJ11_05045 [Phycisphaerae bacterium]|nr:hypothetical protein [Phycisphaerae bacterium]
MLGAWGPCGDCGTCASDLTGNCLVDAADLAILLGGWGACSSTPLNDLCSNATNVVGFTGSANPFCTIGANTDGPAVTCGVPSITGIDGDVWFRFTAPIDGHAQLGVCADFNVRFAVYGQNAFGACNCPGVLFGPALLGCAGTDAYPTCATGAALLIPIVAGECYTVRIGGAADQRGSGNLDINLYVPPCEIASSTTLAATGLEADSEFGIAVDISGDVGVATAIFDDLFFGGSNAGSARVYRYDGQAWIAEQSLLSPEPFPSQRFGVTVGASGNRIAVGAADAESGCLADPDCETGIVYLYEYDGRNWNFDDSLLPSNGTPEDNFGTRVDIDGSRVIVGARTDDNANGVRAGAAYVFERLAIFGGFWLQTAKLIASDGDDFDEFGIDVAVSGTWAIVGADSDEGGGSAYLFQDSAGGWSEIDKLQPAGLVAGGDFGYAVAIDQDIAVVGTPDFNGGTGKAYVFENFGAAGWLHTATLAAHDGSADDRFGSAVSVTGNQVLIGAGGESNDRGAAYLYWKVSGGWVERAKLVASDGVSGDGFAGAGVAISNGRGLIGAYLDHVGLSVDVGSVYRFHGLGECTGNGVADACDIAAGLPDSDDDGIPNVCE